MLQRQYCFSDIESIQNASKMVKQITDPNTKNYSDLK